MTGFEVVLVALGAPVLAGASAVVRLTRSRRRARAQETRIQQALRRFCADAGWQFEQSPVEPDREFAEYQRPYAPERAHALPLRCYDPSVFTRLWGRVQSLLHYALGPKTDDGVARSSANCSQSGTLHEPVSL